MPCHAMLCHALLCSATPARGPSPTRRGRRRRSAARRAPRPAATDTSSQSAGPRGRGLSAQRRVDRRRARVRAALHGAVSSQWYRCETSPDSWRETKMAPLFAFSAPSKSDSTRPAHASGLVTMTVLPVVAGVSPVHDVSFTRTTTRFDNSRLGAGGHVPKNCRAREPPQLGCQKRTRARARCGGAWARLQRRRARKRGTGRDEVERELGGRGGEAEEEERGCAPARAAVIAVGLALRAGRWRALARGHCGRHAWSRHSGEGCGSGVGVFDRPRRAAAVKWSIARALVAIWARDKRTLSARCLRREDGDSWLARFLQLKRRAACVPGAWDPRLRPADALHSIAGIKKPGETAHAIVS
jgi:hypothetical protein